MGGARYKMGFFKRRAEKLFSPLQIMQFEGKRTKCPCSLIIPGINTNQIIISSSGFMIETLRRRHHFEKFLRTLPVIKTVEHIREPTSPDAIGLQILYRSWCLVYVYFTHLTYQPGKRWNDIIVNLDNKVIGFHKKLNETFATF